MEVQRGIAFSGDVGVAGRVLPLPPATVRRVVRTVLEGERRDALVSVSFVGLLGMRRLNARHKQLDVPTDVLSFSLRLPDRRLQGDVYVCRAVARRHARRHGVSEREELIRLLVHGVLHVLGYDHPETARRERSAMWQRQERYVRLLLKGGSGTRSYNHGGA